MRPAYITEYTELNAKERRQLFYKRRFKADQPSWDDSMVLLVKAVGERIGTGVRVLDVGCGHGNFLLDELAGRFAERVGYDVSREATEGNTSVERVTVGDGTTLPFPAEQFDLVTSLWTLEHVERPAALFAEIRRVLRPNGLFAFVTPNRRSWLIQFRRLLSKRTADRLLDRFYGRKDDDVFDVFYRCNTVTDIRALASQCGLNIAFLSENADPSYTSFGPLSYALSRAMSRLPFSFAKPHLVGVCGML